MMTVRFPSGLALTYNEANFLTRERDNGWGLYTGEPNKGGSLIAYVQAGAGVVVEWGRPCWVAREDRPDAGQMLAALRTLPGYEVQRLKKALRAFNARRGAWTA